MYTHIALLLYFDLLLSYAIPLHVARFQILNYYLETKLNITAHYNVCYIIIENFKKL